MPVATSRPPHPTPQVSIVEPVKGADVFVAPSATVLGNVSIGKGSSIWYGATLRGEGPAARMGGRPGRGALAPAEALPRAGMPPGSGSQDLWWPRCSGPGPDSPSRAAPATPCTGDINAITIGERTNIQDNVVIHVAQQSPGEPGCLLDGLSRVL
jgi:hypothetical protein